MISWFTWILRQRLCTGCGGWRLRSRCGAHLLDPLRPLPLWRGSFRCFNNHDAGDEFLHAVEIEINGGTVGIRFGDDTKTVLEVLDIRTFLRAFKEPPWENRAGTGKMGGPASGRPAQLTKGW